MKKSRPNFTLSKSTKKDEQTNSAKLAALVPVTSVKSRRRFLGEAIGSTAALASMNEVLAQDDLDEMPEIGSNLRAHVGSVTALEFHPSKPFLVSGGVDRKLKIWNLPSGFLFKSYLQKSPISNIAIDPSGVNIAVAEDDRIWLEGIKKEFAGKDHPMADLAFQKTNHLISVTDEGKMVRWNFEKDAPQPRQDSLSPCRATEIEFSREREVMLGAGHQNSLTLFNGENIQPFNSLNDSNTPVHCGCFSNDVSMVFYGNENGEVLISDTSTGVKKGTILAHHGKVNGIVSFGEDLLVTIGEDRKIKFWKGLDGKKTKEVSLSSEALSMAISPDQKLLATGHDDGTILLWDLKKMELDRGMVDFAATPPDVEGATIESRQFGRVVWFVLPCGSPTPPGATCVCNCVPGSYSTRTYYETRTVVNTTATVRKGTPTWLNEKMKMSIKSRPLQQEEHEERGRRRRTTTTSTSRRVCVCIPVYY